MFEEYALWLLTMVLAEMAGAFFGGYADFVVKRRLLVLEKQIDEKPDNDEESSIEAYLREQVEKVGKKLEKANARRHKETARQIDEIRQLLSQEESKGK